MASIDELLESANQAGCDDELSFIIDEHLRIITVPERGVVLGVEGDKDVNRVRFRMNRFYHGSDLSEFCIRINYQNADGDINYFTVTERPWRLTASVLSGPWPQMLLWLKEPFCSW